MKIQDALKVTGKANHLRVCGAHAEVKFRDGVQSLVWVYHELPQVADEADELVAFGIQHSDEWGPYHEKKEIRPEGAGELWAHLIGNTYRYYFHTEYDNGRLIFGSTIAYAYVNDAVHGKDGWQRIYPPVEGE